MKRLIVKACAIKILYQHQETALCFYFVKLTLLTNRSSACVCYLVQSMCMLNPIGCGGGNPPPLSYKCSSPKKAQRKSCQFFVTFPKYVNGLLETTFCSQITFGLTGRWQKWSKLTYFRKGGPCREQYDAKIINTYKCQLQHVLGLGTIFRSKVLKVPQIGGLKPTAFEIYAMWKSLLKL